MIVGAHVGVTGGLARAFQEARALGANACQIFVSPPRSWAPPLLSPQPRPKWLRYMAVHAKYLLNLVSSNKALRARSLKTYLAEAASAESVGADALIVHPGSADLKGGQAATRLLEAVEAARDAAPSIALLIENTVGAGSQVGARLEELAEFCEVIGKVRGWGICLDTQHLFAAGYDFRGPDAIADLVARMEDLGMLGFVRAVHLNDSKVKCGSRRDRHENIGDGLIGKKGLGLFMRHPAFNGLPFLMEVPGRANPEGIKPDIAWAMRQTHRKATRRAGDSYERGVTTVDQLSSYSYSWGTFVSGH